MPKESELSAPLCAQAASEDELRYALGLTSLTTGKGKVDLKESNMRPIEVFMCSVVRACPRSCLTLYQYHPCLPLGLSYKLIDKTLARSLRCPLYAM